MDQQKNMRKMNWGKTADVRLPPPPSTDATWRPARLHLLRVGPVEVLDEEGVEDESRGNPAPLLRALTLLVHQILIPPTPTADVQDLTDREGRVIINDTGRRRGDRGRAQRTSPNRFELGCVEYGMYLECSR